METLYTAEALATGGGRNGHVATASVEASRSSWVNWASPDSRRA